MAASCRFAFAVHTLAVLAYKGDAGASSVELARSVNTNPVVIRRLLCDLRAAGFIQTQLGATGGAKLCRQPSSISLDEVFQAVEAPQSFSLHRQQPDAGCPVGRRIKEVLCEIFSEAHTALENALSRRTLADVLEVVRDDTRPTALAEASSR